MKYTVCLKEETDGIQGYERQYNHKRDSANADIKRLCAAKQYLVDSENAINSLIKQAADGQGETATAVVEKANELKMQIEKLISALENTEDYISRTVAKYKRIDKEVTESIINSTRIFGDEINGGN